VFYEPDKDDHGLPFNPYKSIVVPRPIGWISTVSRHGNLNLALRPSTRSVDVQNNGIRRMSKLKIGDVVTYRPQSLHSRDAARGAYQIVRVMPSEKGLTSYRIKSTLEGHERVAEEQELTKDF
jgi:hypothetical protein